MSQLGLYEGLTRGRRNRGSDEVVALLRAPASVRVLTSVAVRASAASL